MKRATNINLLAGTLLGIAGAQRLYMGDALLGWSAIAVGVVMVAQFLWRRRKRSKT